MLVSLNWVKKFTNIAVSDEELIKKISSQIGEIESTHMLAEKYAGIVVAEVTEAKEHPDADKLGVYKVNDGAKIMNVIAGDKTLTVGDKVAYLPPGVTVPQTHGSDEPLVIEDREMRGELSQGMLASSAELDWGKDHSVVVVLDTDAKPGTSLIEAYEMDDTIIEVENKTLTHRPDCFGVIGFAREVAGVTGSQFTTPDWMKLSEFKPEINGDEMPVNIDIQVGDDCPRYTSIVLNNVKLGEAPHLMQSYLSRIGITSINNIVDITNFLMVETGQPMHAFDYDKIKEMSPEKPQMIVRYPKENEQLAVLDGRTLDLTDDTIIIATESTVYDLAGSMGGANSEVSDNTKTIILEVANFDLYNIRRTSMRYGVFTEAVTRYIRGQSPDMCLPVAARAVSMLQEQAKATIASEFYDIYPNRKSVESVNVTPEFINSRLGSELSTEEIATLLQNVEFTVEAKDDELTVVAPFWRQDIHIEEDIMEEVGRLQGYDSLGVMLPARTLKPAMLSPQAAFVQRIRQTLVDAGSNELLNFSFASTKLLEDANHSTDLAYKIQNSISPDLEVVRTGLMPSLLEKVHPNIKDGFNTFGLFEINKSHRNNNIEDDLPVEEMSLAYVFAAKDNTLDEEHEGAAYYQAQHITNFTMDSLSIAPSRLVAPDRVDDEWLMVRINAYQAGRTACLMIGDRLVGVIGELKPSVRKKFKLPKYTSVFEMRVDVMYENQLTGLSYRPASKFPSTSQDVTFKTSKEVSNQELLDSIATEIVDVAYMQNTVTVKDIYQKDEASVNSTFSVELRHSEKTLSTEGASEIINNMVAKIETKFSATRV